MNLGQVCSKLGDDRAPPKRYQEVVKVDPDGDYSGEVKAALAKLKKCASVWTCRQRAL
jgi:hypothetical protein